MSLYNHICGVNEFAPHVVRLIGVHAECVPRFRDAYVNDDAQLVLFARIGGGNRAEHADKIALLQTKIKRYVKDYDDSFDRTFAHFVYAPHSDAKELVDNILKAQGHFDPMENFQKVARDMKAGLKTDETEKAVALGKQILTAVDRKIKE